jgi:methyltransferase (TIGR00027 family)
MQEGKASKTAEYMALFRALESVRPPRKRLFFDPLAADFLSPRLKAATQFARLPLVGQVLHWLIECLWPGVESSGVARTRYIDDLLLEAVGQGVSQLVILGSGFDCRPYRLQGLEAVNVVEVDHPATLRVKRQILAPILDNISLRVRFLPFNFDSEKLEDRLGAILDPGLPTVFIWEGVTNYLSAAAVEKTLCSIRRSVHDSRLIFTYIDKSVLEDDSAFKGATRASRRVSRVGEKWTFGIRPDDVCKYLAERDFKLKTDLDASSYRALYWGKRGARTQGYDFYHVASASAISGSPDRRPDEERLRTTQ